MRRVIDREVFSAQQQAQQILDQAREEAQGMREDARREAREFRRRIVARAYRHNLALWQRSLLDLQEARRRVLEEARPQVVELALAVAAKLLRHTLEISPQAVLPMLQEALHTTARAPAEQMLVTVHPDDRWAVEEEKERLLRRDPRWGVLTVASDERVDRGGCRIETEFGEIDSTVRTQIKAIRQILTSEGIS